MKKWTKTIDNIKPLIILIPGNFMHKKQNHQKEYWETKY